MTSTSESAAHSGASPDTLSEAGRRNAIRFLRRGEIIEIADFHPSRTVLEYLREDCLATGTKEGCAEGDCGACTVVVGSRTGNDIAYRAVNSCVQPLGSLDGKELITVEDLADGGGLHPVQDAMVRLHGSQCGFCTPGFVMAIFALMHRKDGAVLTRQRITDAIAGNLCRCTGYRSIVDAAFEVCRTAPADGFNKSAKNRAASLKKIDGPEDILIGSQDRFFAAPASEDSLAALFLQHSDAMLVAGATDVGLWITKQMRDLDKIIYLGNIQDMRNCTIGRAGIEIGAACCFTDAFDALAGLDPDIGELLRRLGSEQIRNAGTIGGNIANGSPIGDSPPVLIALGATVELRRGDERRVIPLEDFYIAYGKQDRKAGEFVRAIHVPNLSSAGVFRCQKIAKRFDQ
ncbi:MAG: xanthine dehydrogenase small subunit, partial [Fimbriimonadaceae bacterium]|nr:xanthine dehydrogenase small subunit [Alphaproteobacteria bacterium]